MDFGYGNPQVGGYSSSGVSNMPMGINGQFGNSQPPQVYQNRQPSMVGRIITDINVVTPQEVPMNGGIGIFPVQDGSCIYVKSWTGNGTIQTDRYVKESVEQPEIQSEFSIVMDRLDKIETMLSEQFSHRSRPNQNNQKKGGNNNGENA